MQHNSYICFNYFNPLLFDGSPFRSIDGFRAVWMPVLVCLGSVHVVGANAAANPPAPLAALDSRNPSSTLAADLRAADSTLEAALIRDASDGQLDEYSLFAAAEIASGVSTPSQLAAAVAQFDTLSAELRHTVSNIEQAQQRAASVLAFLHRRVFPAGYDLQATELPRAFSAGRFNCVSATVLFNSLAREAGLDARAVRRPNHTLQSLGRW